MSDLDQILDAYSKQRERPDDKSLVNVTVKVSPEVRAEFHAAAKKLGMPRRELAAVLFMHGMERMRRQMKPTGKTDKTVPAPPKPASALGLSPATS